MNYKKNYRFIDKYMTNNKTKVKGSILMMIV